MAKQENTEPKVKKPKVAKPAPGDTALAMGVIPR